MKSSMERRSRRLKNAALSLLGVAIGLALAEVGFRARDRGAFPHLNVYEADPELAVRLRPGAVQRVSFNGNPVTDVRINEEGLRGGALPGPAPDEILVVGDSQVFGLGVQEDEAFAAQLSRILGGRAVVNAGIPTYGPHEFHSVIQRLLEKRHTPKPSARGASPASGLTVVYAVNFANDLFDARHSNRQRHAVWDGWAVRIETAPEHVTRFPGRELLYRDSHAFYALRSLLYRDRSSEILGERGFRSEGRWKDLVGEGEDLKVGLLRERRNLEEEREGALKKADEEVLLSQLEMEKIVREKYPDIVGDALGQAYTKTHGSPGDIVIKEVVLAEEGSNTVERTLAGAAVRQEIEARIRARVDQEVRKVATDGALSTSFQERQARQKKLQDLLAAPARIARSLSPLRPHLERMKALCDEYGARLVVVGLPVDVMVSREEAKKYRNFPKDLDLGPARILVTDLIESSEAMGVSAVDALPVLQAAEPGAFLLGDLHMTPKGHRAVAEALAARIREPPISRLPLPLPPGRSRAPKAEEWKDTAARRLSAGGGHLPIDCEVRRNREWVRLVCKGASSAPTGLSVDRGGRGEAMALVHEGVAALTIPVAMGDEVGLTISWAGGTAQVAITGSAEASPSIQVLGTSSSSAPAPSASVAELCSCHAKVKGGAPCSTFPGAPDVDCSRTYAGDCFSLLACSSGDIFFPPTCQRGWRRAGALEHCFKECSDDRPCEVGRCQPYQGVSLCM